jgi:hypothetical protein
MATSIPVDNTHEVFIEEINDDKQSRAKAMFQTAWTITKTKSRTTRRWIGKHSHKAMSVSKTLTVASLIITAALLCQYIIAAGLMTVFSLGFVTAWWMAILPAMLLLLSTIGFAQEVVAASQMKKMLESMPIFNS